MIALDNERKNVTGRSIRINEIGNCEVRAKEQESECGFAKMDGEEKRKVVGSE